MTDVMLFDAPLVDTAFWVVLVVAGSVYVAASILLFLFGTNLTALSVITLRRNRGQGQFADVELADQAELASGDIDLVSTDIIDLTNSDTQHLPMVTVQLPIYNELYVAARVISSVAELNYPKDRLEIQVLDDSTDVTTSLVASLVEELQETGLDIVHVRRPVRTGYKAGALAHGLETAKGELVAIFDADFICPPDYLLQSVGHFSDPDLAFVQARWGHSNRSYSWLTKLQSLAIDGHFMVEQMARERKGFWFNFNGTAGIWRVTAIRDAGGWTADTLTEDLDLSYRAHLRGWHGVYRSDIEVKGEVPAQMSSFRRQQHRWARGSMECAQKLLPLVWRSQAKRSIKVQATAHLAAYGVHLLLFAIALVYPLVVLAIAQFESLTSLYGVGYVLAVSSLAPAAFFVTGQRELGRPVWRQLPQMLAMITFGSGLMLNTARAALQIWTKPSPEFERTAKFGIDQGDGTEDWTHKRYQLELDRIVYFEALLGLYTSFTVWLAFSYRNWGIVIYGSVFTLGLFAIVIVTVSQAITVNRARQARRQEIELEQQEILLPTAL